MEIIDVFQETKWQSPLLEKISKIKYSKHYNSKNYDNFSSRLLKYDHFTILVDNDNIVAMAGLYNNGIFPSNTIRGLDRTYYFDWENKKLSLRYASQLFWPKHCELANARGYESIFFSIQNLKKRRAFHDFVGRLNPSVEVLNGLYNTCPPLKDKKIKEHPLCWQNIAVHKFRESTFNLPRIDYEQYKQKYKNSLPIR